MLTNSLTVLLPLLLCGPSFRRKEVGVQGVNPTISTTLPRVNAFRDGSHVVGTTFTASGVSLALPTHTPGRLELRLSMLRLYKQESRLAEAQVSFLPLILLPSHGSVWTSSIHPHTAFFRCA